MNYIPTDKLIAEIERRIQNLRGIAVDNPMLAQTMRLSFEGLLSFIDSLQQDDTQVDKMLCSQIWWEEQGWIMIPPDVTIEGIDSLLKQVRKKLQQEQPEGGYSEKPNDLLSEQEPTLPSNLDEAAEDSWSVYEYRESPRGLYSTCYVDGFKAGAEWMARQGVILNLSIDEFSCGAYNACVEQGLISEDDVIVQIRKKKV